MPDQNTVIVVANLVAAMCCAATGLRADQRPVALALNLLAAVLFCYVAVSYLGGKS